MSLCLEANARYPATHYVILCGSEACLNCCVLGVQGYHTVNRYTLYTIHKHANDVSLEVSRKQHELDELKKQTSSLLAAVHQKRKAKEILTKFKHLRQESGVKYQE